jgi:tetratricopeptide (TPR) repeat protein
MRQLYLVITLTAVFLLMACQSVKNTRIDPTSYLNDQAFPDYENIPIESQQEVFALDQDAKDFVTATINPIADDIEKMETLAYRIFDRSDLNLLYMASANTTATETFHNRAANCLSMSIMTYALAKQAGFGVRFQDVEIPEYWTRREGYSLLNGHINLQMLPRPNMNVTYFQTKGFQVDFAPREVKKHFPKKIVSVETVLAMYYNNKGADALLQKDFTKAYAYFRAATKTDPEFDSTWTNLGFLYRLEGYYQSAEDSYQHAIDLNPENLTAWENLAFLYGYTNRPVAAKDINERLERKRFNNPYYHINLGDEEFEKENWDIALEHYRRALSLDKTKHEVYFGLAKTYYELGAIQRSKRYFALAKRFSNDHQDQERYQGKLDLLTKVQR